jgi:hypothetical protein
MNAAPAAHPKLREKSLNSNTTFRVTPVFLTWATRCQARVLRSSSRSLLSAPRCSSTPSHPSQSHSSTQRYICRYFYGSEQPQTTGPPDLYSILGVQSEASTPDIKAAYRKLAVKLHPDKNPGCTTCAQDFSEVARAYEVLSEPDRRQQ